MDPAPARNGSASGKCALLQIDSSRLLSLRQRAQQGLRQIKQFVGQPQTLIAWLVFREPKPDKPPARSINTAQCRDGPNARRDRTIPFHFPGKCNCQILVRSDIKLFFVDETRLRRTPPRSIKCNNALYGRSPKTISYDLESPIDQKISKRFISSP